ncbi:hypothetical protein BDV96DRAFT_260379 [Lophiotrema nucula]|uniref:F-box domain-containing protein n=1 Tax=Lophiotrema nucula TaxID=690887 RepID=A0A6A5YR19_9PLEO|nr:hypothetical protein BDV96DRAFT_260379 [Lophiotrema nucula]
MLEEAMITTFLGNSILRNLPCNGRPSMSTKMDRDVPDELLSQITASLSKIQDLQGLALTCKRLTPVAQEALVRKAAVQYGMVPRLVEMLYRSPVLGPQMKNLYLVARDTWNPEEPSVNIQYQMVPISERTQVPALSFKSKSDQDAWNAVFLGNHDAEMIAMLLKKTRNLEAVTLNARRPENVPILGDALIADRDDSPQWKGLHNSILPPKLERLSVENSHKSILSGSALTFRAFSDLRIVSLSDYNLVAYAKNASRVVGSTNHIEKRFPTSLEVLEIHRCWPTCPFWLRNIPFDGDLLPKLQTIRIFYDANIAKVLGCHRNRWSGPRALDVIRRLRDLGIQLESYFLDCPSPTLPHRAYGYIADYLEYFPHTHTRHVAKGRMVELIARYGQADELAAIEEMYSTQITSLRKEPDYAAIGENHQLRGGKISLRLTEYIDDT